MPDGLIPSGYQAALLGSAGSVEGLGTFAPMEEGLDEGSLLFMQLDFAHFPDSVMLAELEEKLRDAGVSGWPGYPFIVYADTTKPTVYIVWQKGVAWMSIIIGILVMMLLPALLGGLIWLLIPESVKQMINMLISMGMMMLMLWLVMRVVKPLTAPERTKRVEEART